MVGIKDLAKKAGVSISTASYALNGSARVSEKTRDRILAIADEMNYIPNMAGRHLRKKSTEIIGVYLTSYKGTFYADLLEAMLEAVKEKGYDLITCSGDRSRLFLPQGMIDGALVLDAFFPDEEIMNYAKRGKSIVVMDRTIAHANIRQVLLDNRGGAKQAVNLLLRNKPSQLFVISGPCGNYDSDERLIGAEEVLATTDIAYQILPGDYTAAAGYKAGQQIFERYQNKPIGIFALNDEMAIGLYNYFKTTALEIGKDIFIVGFDNIEIGDYLKPTLTSIGYSESEWGKVAVNTLLAMIEGMKTEDRNIQTKIYSGDSA